MIDIIKMSKFVEVSHKEAVSNLLRLAVWPLLGQVCHPVYTIVNSAFLGHEPTTYPLSAFGLGSLTLGIFMFSTGASFTSGMATFVSQAHGQQDPRLCRVYLNRQIMLNCVSFGILFIPMIFIKQIYRAIGQDEQVLTLAAEYVHIVSPFAFFFFQSQAFQYFAMS